MYKFPLDITKDVLTKNNLKSITLMNILDDPTTPPRLIVDRGEDTERYIDGEEEIDKFVETLKQ